MKPLTQFSIKKIALFSLFLITLLFSRISQAQCTGPANDCDNDGVVDFQDLDDDNDGILDSTELRCDQPNAANSTSGTGTLQDQLYFFNWTNSVFDNGPNNGESQTFTIGTGADILQVVATVTSVSITGGNYLPTDMATWPGASFFTKYNTNGDREAFYGTIGASIDITITFVGTKNGNSYPLDLLAFDPEATGSNEQVVYTTNGEQWEFVETIHTGSSGTNGTYTVSGQTLTTTETYQTGSSLYVSNNASEIRTQVTIGGGRQGVAFGLFLRCDTDNDGIPNSLDTDSDGDGCFDALEGGDGISAPSVDGDGRLKVVSGSTTGVSSNVNATTGQTVGNSTDNTTSDSFGQCDSDGDGVVDADDKCNGFNDALDNDNDTIPDGCDLDDDNDGILDTNECLEPGATSSGITGSITPTSWSISSPSGSSGPVIFNSFTFNGNVVSDFQSPVAYNENFVKTSPPFGISDITRRTYGVEDLDFTTAANWNTDILPVFQTRDMNVYQDLQVDVINDVSYYEIKFDPPVISKDLLYALVFEKSGNNQVSIEALDFGKNSLGTPVNVNNSDYIDTGSSILANSVESLEIATYPIDNLAPIGSEIYWIRVYDRYNGTDAADGKVFLMAAPGVPFNCIDTDNDGKADKLDTDSDNDGCPDAVEAAGSFLPTQLTTLVSGSNGTGSSLLNFGTAVNTTQGSANYGLPTQDANGLAITANLPQATAAAVTSTAINACEADLSLTKTVDKTIVKVGDIIIYTLTIKNDGSGDATGVQVTDVLPAGITYVSDNSATTSTTYTGNVWNVGDLNVNQTKSLQITATVSGVGTIVNTAQVTQSNQRDTDSTPNNGN